MEKIWSLKKADDEFSLWIRNRDGMCMHPRCAHREDREIKKLQNSHYWSRGIMILRFHPDNCDSAHAGCHKFKWENDKAGDYMDFKIDQLGQKKFNAMRKIAMDYKHGKIKTTQREEIIKVMRFLEKQNHV